MADHQTGSADTRADPGLLQREAPDMVARPDSGHGSRGPGSGVAAAGAEGTESGERMKCPRCGMTFRLEAAPSPRLEYTWCVEAGCNLRFWHGGAANLPVRVGIDPADWAAS